MLLISLYNGENTLYIVIRVHMLNKVNLLKDIKFYYCFACSRVRVRVAHARKTRQNNADTRDRVS